MVGLGDLRTWTARGIAAGQVRTVGGVCSGAAV